MAACANLSGKGWYRLAFLPQQPHQLVIVTICQADGLQMDSIMCTSQSSPTWTRCHIQCSLQCSAPTGPWWWYPGSFCWHFMFTCTLKTPEFALLDVKNHSLKVSVSENQNHKIRRPKCEEFSCWLVSSCTNLSDWTTTYVIWWPCSAGWMAANKSKVPLWTCHGMLVLSVLTQMKTFLEHFCPRRTEMALQTTCWCVNSSVDSQGLCQYRLRVRVHITAVVFNWKYFHCVDAEHSLLLLVRWVCPALTTIHVYMEICILDCWQSLSLVFKIIGLTINCAGYACVA